MPDVIKLNSAIDSYASQAIGAEDSELSTQRALALDAYAGKNIEPADEGRSQVVDWAGFETVQWILPSLTRIFAAGDDVVEFEPENQEDEDAAKQESEYLNYLVTQRNNWFLTCLTWFQDALITKNAYCMAYIEEKITPEIEKYEDQTEEQVALIVDDDVEVIGHEQKIDENSQTLLDPVGQPVDPSQEQAVLQAYQAQGIEPQYAPSYLYDVEVRRVKAQKRLQLKVLPPERCLVGQDTNSFSLEECNYFEFRDLTTISDLRKEGHEVDDDISDDGYTETQEDYSRDEIIENGIDIDSPDPSMRQVLARHIWIRHDYDEDGIAELQYVLRVGREVLERQEVSRIPIACIVPFINTHRHLGVSVMDLVFDIGRIKTAILRAGLDSLNLSIRPERLVSKHVNIDDMMVTRPGGIKRLKGDALTTEGHVQDLVVPNVFPSAQEGLLHMDSVRDARVGVNRQFRGIDESASNDYNRLNQLTTMASQRVEQIARIFANGVESLFAICHELIIKSGHKAESIKLRGGWVDINPSQWRTGRDMRVVAPFAAGNKDSLLQRLMLIKDIHIQALQGGLPIVDAGNAYNLALEISAAADLAGYKFFTNPDSIPPAPPPRDYTGEAVDIEARKVQAEEVDEKRKSEIEKYKTDRQIEIDKYRADLQAQTQVTLARIKAGQSVDLENLKAGLRDAPINTSNELSSATLEAIARLHETVTDSSEKLAMALKGLESQANGRKRIIRDGKGNIVGVEPA